MSKTRQPIDINDILPGYEKEETTSTKETLDSIPPGDVHDDNPVEAIPGTKKRKRGSMASRMTESIRKHNNGHLVSPLGEPDRRIRKFDPRKARDIGQEGEVTPSQLWRHLHSKYENAFGPDVLEAQLPQDRNAIVAWFDGFRSKFARICGHRPSYRDLSEYFTWILDPSRLRKVMNVGSLTNSRSFLRVQQMEGGVYMRTFFENELSKKSAGGTSSNLDVVKWGDAIRETAEAFDEMDRARGDPIRLVLCMVKFGFSLVLQFHVERRGMTGERARREVIDVASNFVRESTNEEMAVRYMRNAARSSRENSRLYTEETVLKGDSACEELLDEIIARRKTNGQKEVHRL